jgi:hypothetical protein
MTEADRKIRDGRTPRGSVVVPRRGARGQDDWYPRLLAELAGSPIVSAPDGFRSLARGDCNSVGSPAERRS